MGMWCDCTKDSVRLEQSWELYVRTESLIVLTHNQKNWSYAHMRQIRQIRYLLSVYDVSVSLGTRQVPVFLRQNPVGFTLVLRSV